MKEIRCPKCGYIIQIQIQNATDEFGEEFRCNNCGFIVRYAER